MKTSNTMKENLNDHNEATLSHLSELNTIRLSPHFKLSEFLNLRKHPGNFPTIQAVVNLAYGCHLLLEPARIISGPIIINSGFRCETVNRKVGGVSGSQHLIGQAADIRPKDPSISNTRPASMPASYYIIRDVTMYPDPDVTTKMRKNNNSYGGKFLFSFDNTKKKHYLCTQ